MLFFVDYDLRVPGQKYDALWAELSRIGARRLLDSNFCFSGSGTAEQWRDHFRRFIDANDGIVVSQVNDWATYNTLSTPNQLRAA